MAPPSLGLLSSGGLRGVVAGLALALPLVVALVLSVPGWWGIGGRLQPVDLPADWAAARAVVRAEPGTVLNLPWSEYPHLSFLGGDQVFNPVPDYLGGDVISSYDPGFDRERPSQEQVDRRAVVVDELVAELVDGAPVSADLAQLGVRWVLLVHEDGDYWEEFESLAWDPGLRQVLVRPDLDLYEVVAWRGEAVGPDGGGHRLDRPLPPVLTTDAPEGSVLNVAGAPGWIQGWGAPAEVTDDGRLRLTGSGGIVWFAPAVVLVVVDLALAGAVAVAGRRLGLGRRASALVTRSGTG